MFEFSLIQPQVPSPFEFGWFLRTNSFWEIMPEEGLTKHATVFVPRQG